MEYVELRMCDVERARDYITVYDKTGKELGTIQGDVNEDWAKVLEGHDPIEEHWEDGNGNTCTLAGWD